MIVALAGGVGGAKLARGLAAVWAPERLLIAVNTGDDFEHMGLHVSPDIDTMTYTLAGLNDRAQGWGLAGETWRFMAAAARLGGADWFRLGDADLATHVVRTERLRRGEPLSAITADFARALGIAPAVVPMSDDAVRSVVETDEGDLAFQDYFVRRRCEPRFLALRAEGAERARPAAALVAALDDTALETVVICPSNPVLSIGPMLAVPGIAERLRARRCPLVSVSPFVGGDAVKGPAAKIMRELGLEPTPRAVADAYAGLLDGLVIDARDEDAPRAEGLAHHVTDTLMRDDDDQRRLAEETIAFARRLGRG